jgi:hypothetical protein
MHFCFQCGDRPLYVTPVNVHGRANGGLLCIFSVMEPASAARSSLSPIGGLTDCVCRKPTNGGRILDHSVRGFVCVKFITSAELDRPVNVAPIPPEVAPFNRATKNLVPNLQNVYSLSTAFPAVFGTLESVQLVSADRGEPK